MSMRYRDNQQKETNLDWKEKFVNTMLSAGICPEGVATTIAEIFFAGNIDDLHYLFGVLKETAGNYISPPQRRLVMAHWAAIRGLRHEYGQIEWEQTS